MLGLFDVDCEESTLGMRRNFRYESKMKTLAGNIFKFNDVGGELKVLIFNATRAGWSERLRQTIALYMRTLSSSPGNLLRVAGALNLVREIQTQGAVLEWSIVVKAECCSCEKKENGDAKYKWIDVTGEGSYQAPDAVSGLRIFDRDGELNQLTRGIINGAIDAGEEIREKCQRSIQPTTD
jgi:hypothetical protein